MSTLREVSCRERERVILKDILLWVIIPLICFGIVFAISGVVINKMNDSVPEMKQIIKDCNSCAINQTDNRTACVHIEMLNANATDLFLGCGVYKQ